MKRYGKTRVWVHDSSCFCCRENGSDKRRIKRFKKIARRNNKLLIDQERKVEDDEEENV